MIRITSAQVTPAVRSLFRLDEPQARRCFAVLDGVPPPGTILVDDPVDPKWAVVQEAVDRSLYLGGSIPLELRQAEPRFRGNRPQARLPGRERVPLYGLE